MLRVLSLAGKLAASWANRSARQVVLVGPEPDATTPAMGLVEARGPV